MVLTSRSRLCQQFLYDCVVGALLGDARILDELLLDSNANVVHPQKLLELLEGFYAVIAFLVND